MWETSGSSLGKFIDFLLATKPKALSGPDQLVSQASKHRTYLYPLMLRGLARDQIIQGGSEIVDFVQLKISRSYRHYNPTDQFSFTGDNSLTMLKVPWRFCMVDSVTYEHEIDLNQGSREVVFKRVARAKKARMEQDFFEGHEDDLWAEPDNATMEATALGNNIGRPLSLRCFITDDGEAPTGFTTVMGVNPSDFPNWKNQVASFDNTSKTTREGSVLNALDSMWLSVQFKSPSNSQEYIKDTTLSKYRIVCNKRSYLELVHAATSKNNILTPRHDVGWANGIVTYHGMPITYIGILDDIDTGNETGATNLFKYRFINFNHIRPIYHSSHFRNRKRKDGGAANPHAEVVLEDTWYNLWCSNRREQGVVKAGTSLEV